MGTGATRGSAVTILGTTAVNSEHECVIELDSIIASSQSTPPATLAMGSLSVGGSTNVGLQIGVPGSVGPNNIGLDACVWGKITAVSTDPELDWFTVDDGSGRPIGNGVTGVVVTGPTVAQGRSVGEFVTVRGSVTMVDETHHYPAIRVADPTQDISAH